MEDLLYCKKLYAPIKGEGSKPNDMKDDDWEILNRQVVGYILQRVDDSVYHHIANEISAQALWKKLEELYERKTAGNKALLIRKLVNLKFKNGSAIAEHLNEMQSIINQLATMKMVIEDELQALLLLSSLPESWETLVISLSNSAPDGILTMSQVTSSLLNEETRRLASESSTPQALAIERKGRSNFREHGNYSNSRSKSKSRKDMKCHHCQKGSLHQRVPHS